MYRYLYITVIRVAIGERELRALGDDVDELRLGHVRHVESGQERELLQADRALPPGAGLAHLDVAVREGRGRFERRLPFGQVLSGHEATALAREAVDLLGDEALVEGAARALDLLLARAAAGLVEQSLPRRGESRIAEGRPRRRRREVQRRRPRPPAQERRDAPDRHRDPGDDGIPVLGVLDRERKDVLEPPGPELASQQQPAAQRPRSHRREQRW